MTEEQLKKRAENAALFFILITTESWDEFVRAYNLITCKTGDKGGGASCAYYVAQQSRGRLPPALPLRRGGKA